MKKLLLALCLALALCLLLAACGNGGEPAEEEPAEEEEIECLEYELNEDEESYAVVSIGTVKSKQLVIPAEYEGKPVTVIAERAFYRCGITSVTFESGCRVERIDNQAFAECHRLTRVTVPASVRVIGSEVFSGCTTLTDITVESANTIYHSNNNCLIKTATGTLIAGCKGSVIPADGSVTAIAPFAFSGCSGMRTITVPAAITTIGRQAFYNCAKLIEVYNLSPASTENTYLTAYAACVHTSADEASHFFTDDGGYVFYENQARRYLIDYMGEQTALTLPASCNGSGYEIYRNAFSYRKDITHVAIPEGVSAIGEQAFLGCSAMTELTIAPGVRSIAARAFQSCSGITELILPDSVTGIGKEAFDSCDKLTAITISNGLTSIGESVFANCYNLVEVEIPASVSSIGNLAFSCCSGLTTLTIPAGLSTIGDEAFAYCNSLTDVYYGGSTRTWPSVLIGKYNSDLKNATLHFAN